ncbi:hypothetical protein BH09ACT12_BH09ACT12_33440 [soil metagenome]
MPHLRQLTSPFLAALLAVLPVLVALAPPAEAHPFGPPQTAEVSVADDQVRVRWHFGATDDVSYLAAALDVLPPDRVMLDGAVIYQDGDDGLLSVAPAFQDYLLEHIRVARAGQSCSGTVESTEDLPSRGVLLGFGCSESTGPVSVTIDMLTDLHPAYRTLATGPGGQRAFYAADQAGHNWDLDVGTARPSEDLGASAAHQLGTVIGGLAVLACLIVGAWWWRRRPARTKDT